MKMLALIGHLAVGYECLDGQTVKTKILHDALQDCFGKHEILPVDSHGWARHPVRFAWQIYCATKQAKNIVMLPAHNGLRVFAPLLSTARLLHRKCKLHYVVIGGWLPDFVRNRRMLKLLLKKFDGIYVETRTMKTALEAQGFSNVYIMPNCKNLVPRKPDELVYSKAEPYKLCTFSRVMREKGIEDAIYAVRFINEQLGRVGYRLDIYGSVDKNQTQWFESLQEKFPEYVHYKGVVQANQSVETLKDYFALLFPTRFYTEGIPGTIIDAYAAGVPVISAKWESFHDVVNDGYTGFGYTFQNQEELIKLLARIIVKPEMIMELKKNCLAKAMQYHPDYAMEVLVEQLEK